MSFRVCLLPCDEFRPKMIETVNIDCIHIIANDIHTGDADVVQREPVIVWSRQTQEAKEKMIEKALVTDQCNDMVSVMVLIFQFLDQPVRTVNTLLYSFKWSIPPTLVIQILW